MDVDIIFQTNIFDLWKQFRNFNNSQVFGMVENLSDWYLNKDGKKSVWPALVCRKINIYSMLEMLVNWIELVKSIKLVIRIHTHSIRIHKVGVKREPL